MDWAEGKHSDGAMGILFSDIIFLIACRNGLARGVRLSVTWEACLYTVLSALLIALVINFDTNFARIKFSAHIRTWGAHPDIWTSGHMRGIFHNLLHH